MATVKATSNEGTGELRSDCLLCPLQVPGLTGVVSGPLHTYAASSALFSGLNSKRGIQFYSKTICLSTEKIVFFSTLMLSPFFRKG